MEFSPPFSKEWKWDGLDLCLYLQMNIDLLAMSLPDFRQAMMRAGGAEKAWIAKINQIE